MSKILYSILLMTVCSMSLFSQPHEWTSLEGDSHKLLGKVVGDRYFSYDGWFSVVIPTTVWDGYITDHYPESNLAGVMFFNDMGYLLKVEVDPLPAEVCSIIGCYPSIREEVLDALFYDALLPQLKESVPDLQLIHERKLSLENNQPALYAVINMPESATIINKHTGRCLDSKRGYMLTFSKEKRLIIFSIQDTYSLLPGCVETAQTYLKERLLGHLIKVQRSYKHESSID